MDFDFDNRLNFSWGKLVPVDNVSCCLGIDEAGRGPVLGPMVYACAYCPISYKETLSTCGFADSKVLTESRREELLDKLLTDDKIGMSAEILSPNFISNSMLKRNKYNLNAVSHDTASLLIGRILQADINLTEVFVDTVGDPASYQAKLSTLYPQITFTVTTKADSLFPVVSAASIVAKVTRDRMLRNWRFIEGIEVTDYGSGYPGDPKTKQFLLDNLDLVFGFPQMVRFSWSTADNILTEKAALIKWEDEESENDRCAVAMTTFLNRQRQVKQAKHRFFTERHLKYVDNI